MNSATVLDGSFETDRFDLMLAKTQASRAGIPEAAADQQKIADKFLKSGLVLRAIKITDAIAANGVAARQ